MHSVRKLLESAVASRIGSAAAAAWGDLNDPDRIQTVYVGREGWMSSIPALSLTPKAVDANTYFDLASLTKILSTTAICMKAVDLGRLTLTPALRGYLSHTSGYPAWKPLYEGLRNRFAAQLPFVPVSVRRRIFLDELMKVAPESPTGLKTVYSDIGFLRLMVEIEARLGQSIDVLAHELWSLFPEVQGEPCQLHYRPVVMDSLGERYRLSARGESVAMTEWCPWRGLLQGQVHDDNTWSMGGIASHAGVFGRLTDVVSWIRGVFAPGWVSEATIREFSSEVLLTDGTGSGHGSGRGLGFDRVARDGSGSTAWGFSPESIGHLGFTGTSLWVDLDQGRFAVLLTNRVHPLRSDSRIRDLRRAFHSLQLWS
jgi:CubicO group peptidase (beta-lactamase class C family)